MKTIQEMLQELSQCIVTVSGEFRFRTNWNGGKVPQPEKPDLDVFDPNVPFCIENIGDVQASIRYNTKNTNIRISKDYKTWNDYKTGDSIILDPTDRVYIKSDYVNDTGNSNPRFVFNGDGARLRARGNIASLIYGTNDAYINKYTSTEVNCYNYMFSGCTSLTQAPELPATTLVYSCYSYMFYGCTSLTQAPELPATTLATFCYNAMFQGCTSLTQAPELPATTLVTNCYQIMFSDCTSLTRAPELPATTLADSCYFDMFSNCTSLTQAPELPATTLADRCYYYMFSDCTSLTQAPVLPAITLTNECYRSMFYRCAKLNYVKCLAKDTSATECTTSWLYNVASTGTFECDNKKYFTVDSISGIPTGWTITEINPDPPAPPEPEKPDLDTFDPNVPFCIENVGDAPVEIGLYNTGKSAVRSNCKISTNLKTWSDYNLVFTDDDTSNDIGRILLQNKGDRVYIKADNTPLGEYPPYPYPYTQFKVFNPSESKKIRARGNIASLNKGTDDTYKTNYLILKGTGNYCYYRLFKDCTSLTQAPELPATELAIYCYNSMFQGCTSLVQAPELPATTLANYCYQYMFTRCTALINAPKLPATEMQYGCYENMFYACRSLTQAPELPAIIVKSYSYAGMFQRCTSLTQAPRLPATTLGNSCYINMFNGCTSLTQAPELPATKLANYCYRWIFQGCTKLNYVKCLATDTSATECTTNWLSNVSATGDFYTPAATTWASGNNGIPSGWTRHDIT